MRTEAAANIEAIGQYAENLYDRGKEQDWKAAATDAAALRKAAATLGADDALQTQVAEVDSAVKRRDGRALMDIANALTRQAAEMLRPHSPPVPVDVTLLDFYGRELEIASAANDLPRLRSTGASIASTWSTLRPAITARGGLTAAVRFDSLVEQLARARTAADFGAIATPILDEVDGLESVFATKPG